MKIIIAVATYKEVEPFLLIHIPAHNSNKKCFEFVYKNASINILITGVGMVETSYRLTKFLTSNDFDFCLNIGICGSFNYNLALGSVVNIYQDTLSELGAENGNAFLSLDSINLAGVSSVVNYSESNFDEINILPKVNGITVNTVHGNNSSIEKVITRLNPVTESMEGFSFMYVCNEFKLPYFQIRAVSNYVEARNKDAWDIKLAIKNINDFLIKFIYSVAN